MPIRAAEDKVIVPKVRRWTRGPLLYHGATAAVYQAIDDESGDKQEIAVKSVPVHKVAALRTLRNERKMLEKLSNCPQIVQFRGAATSDRVPEFGDQRTMNLFLEYVPKGDLNRLLLSCEGQKLSEAVCMSYTRDLLHALSFMHEHRVVHGNLNGSNVLVGSRSVKLCDFGLSWDSRFKTPKWIQDCYNGMRLGDPQKVPESFFDTPEWGHPMDVFLLGCLVCEMLTGRRARLSDSRNSGLEGNEVQAPKTFANLIVRIPKVGWEDKPLAHDFVAKCLIKEPRFRWTPDQLRKHPWIEDVDDLTIVVTMNRWHSLKFSC